MEVNNIHLENLTLLTTSNKKMPMKGLISQPLGLHCQANISSESIALTVNSKINNCHSNVCNKVFVQTLNPTLGRLEWEVQDEDYDYAQEVARSAYADMLHDDERNELYYAGLHDAVKILRSRGESVRVLDIGTGTGLLSMMAVRCGADQVIACEAFEPMAQCAEKILLSNNMADKVRVIHKRSTELVVGPGQDLPQRANLLVAELFDTELIGEGAIGTYAHAMECLLTPDALLVPSSARVVAQVVSSPTLHSFSQPYFSVPPHLSHIRLPASLASCPGSVSVHDIQMSQLPAFCFEPVSRPITVFEFDWSGRTIALTKNETTHHKFSPLPQGKRRDKATGQDPAQEGRSSPHNFKTHDSNGSEPKESSPHKQCVDKRKVQQLVKYSNDIDRKEHTLNCHAVLMWWQITMDQAGDINLTCAPSWQQPDDAAPNAVPWRDHWMQAVYHLPPPIVPVQYTMSQAIKDEPPHRDLVGFATSEDLVLTAAHDEYSMWFDVSCAQEHTPTRPLAPHCRCGVHLVTSRTRLAQISDPRRLSVYSAAVSSTLEHHQNTAWLLLGDGLNLLIIGQLASDTRASHVFVHERCQQGRRLLLEMIETNDFERRVTLLPDDLSHLSADMVKHQIGVVFSEPHFHTSMLPWYNIRANILMCENARLLAPPPQNNVEVLSFGKPSPIPKVSSPSSYPIVYDGALLDEYLKHNDVPWGVLRSLTSAVVLPAKMTVYAMPVCFLNLWKIRAPCEQRCGFNLEIFDKMIDRARCKTDDYVEPQPLWEYPCYALHEPIHLLTLDFSKDLLNFQVRTESAVNLDLETLSQCAHVLRDLRNSCFGSRGGECAASRADTECATGEGEHTVEESDTADPGQLHYNGVAVWVDWDFGEDKVTTGPVEKVVVGQQVTWDMYSHQGVHLPRVSVPLLEPRRGAVIADVTPSFEPRCFFYSVHLIKGAMTFSFELSKENSPLEDRSSSPILNGDI